MEKFGDKLRNIREKKGISKEEMSKALGISTKTLYRYERNKAEPTISIIQKMASILNISDHKLLSYLFKTEKSDKNVQENLNIDSQINNSSNITIGKNISIALHKKEISDIEDKLLESYRSLPEELQELYFHKIRAEAIENRRRGREK